MRVPHGRLKAVLVALLATTILIGIPAPTSAQASDPPGLARFMVAISRVESGVYTARNPRTGAYGKYQIIPSSWRAWARLYLGDANARPTPANQEIVATAKFRALYNWLGGSWRRVAYAWLTGSSRTTGWSSFARSYVNRVMAHYAATPEPKASAAAPEVASAAASPAVRRISESSSAVTYTGRWRVSSSRAYAGGAVRYATGAGNSATVRFTGTKVAWVGPLGRTRGWARIYVDGAYIGKVNLHRTQFVARKILYRHAWPEAGEHTLRVQVLGTRGHPSIAVDEFLVTE